MSTNMKKLIHYYTSALELENPREDVKPPKIIFLPNLAPIYFCYFRLVALKQETAGEKAPETITLARREESRRVDDAKISDIQ